MAVKHVVSLDWRRNWQPEQVSTFVTRPVVANLEPPYIRSAPVSPRARMGLYAALITVGAFTVVGLLVAVLAGGRKPSTSVDTPSTGYTSAKQADDWSYVRGHKWWTKAPSKEALELLVQFVIETNSGDRVYVSAKCEYFRYSEKLKQIMDMDEWESLRKYHPLVIQCDWGKRPSAKQVLDDIRSDLDSLEYKGK